jgi:cysteine synthase
MPKLITEKNYNNILKNAKRCKERGIILPTIKQQINPETIPENIKQKLPDIGLSDINPLNLFRINWKNDIQTGLFGKPNFFEIPSSLTGVQARIIGMVGKYFPTGSHKVGAAYGCLIPRLVSGTFDPETQKAVWPSTGNYCRGGAFDCAMLDSPAIAILPEKMSQERFDWLRQIGAEIYITPGCESNVKEIYDLCAELHKDPHNVIFNQFEEFGNPFWHYHITGNAIKEVWDWLKGEKSFLSGFVCAIGSAGTMGAGDFLKKHFHQIKITAAESLECPTMLMNGFGAHRIEGVGDRQITWIHNVRNSDAVAAIHDEDCLRLFRLFNETAGQEFLIKEGIPEDVVQKLPLLGISSIANLLASIKLCKYFEFGKDNLVFTIFTDSAELYQSRLEELRVIKGKYNERQAALDWEGPLKSQNIDHFLDLRYTDKKRIHNLKYYTWVEQRGKSDEELINQWEPDYWQETFEDNLDELDNAIEEFNALL